MYYISLAQYCLQRFECETSDAECISFFTVWLNCGRSISYLQPTNALFSFVLWSPKVSGFVLCARILVVQFCNMNSKVMSLYVRKFFCKFCVAFRVLCSGISGVMVLLCLGFRPDGEVVEQALVTKSMTKKEYDDIVKKVKESATRGNKLESYEESYVDHHRPGSTDAGRFIIHNNFNHSFTFLVKARNT